MTTKHPVRWKQKKLVNRGLFQVRAENLRQGDYIPAVCDSVRFTQVTKHITKVTTSKREIEWPNNKRVKVYHGRWT
jgi:hypothetical protein